MNATEIDYERRLCEAEIDTTMKTFMDIMDGVAAQRSEQWSFAGGLPRDLYKGKPFNDYDVCIRDVEFARAALEQVGVLVKGEYTDGEIPHDFYVDPYSFDKRQVPIHWIHAEDAWAFAPTHFDFGINQICLKSDGYFYAPKATWRDLDRGIIRMTADKLTTSSVARAIRFSAKYDMTIDSDLNKEIGEFVAGRVDTNYLLRTCIKMIEDGTEERCFKFMQRRKFPHMEECKTMDDYIRKLERIIIGGQGYRERITRRGGGY